MRKVTYGAAVSLDGYIAGPQEAMDWLLWSDDASQVSAASWEGIDTVLMGRKTYEFAARSGGGQGPSAVKTYIFSSTIGDAIYGEVIREDAVGFVRELKSSAGGSIMVMGGGELGSSLLAGGAVDALEINVHPILLGGGTPRFRAMDHRIELDLVHSRAISRNCLVIQYRVNAHSLANTEASR